jgi:hypothetical protein
VNPRFGALFRRRYIALRSTELATFCRTDPQHIPGCPRGAALIHCFIHKFIHSRGQFLMRLAARKCIPDGVRFQTVQPKSTTNSQPRRTSPKAAGGDRETGHCRHWARGVARTSPAVGEALVCRCGQRGLHTRTMNEAPPCMRWRGLTDPAAPLATDRSVASPRCRTIARHENRPAELRLPASRW